MKFKVESVCFTDNAPNPTEEFVKIMDTYCTREGEDWFIDVKYICELQPIIEALDRKQDEIYSYRSKIDSKIYRHGWPPSSVVINFCQNVITLYDFYLES